MFFATWAWDAADELIRFANCVTMKLDNQQNGWKGVCSYQEANGDPLPRNVIVPMMPTPPQAQAWGCYNKNCYLSVLLYGKAILRDLLLLSSVLRSKPAACTFEYPLVMDIPINRINAQKWGYGASLGGALCFINNPTLTAYQLWTLMSVHFLLSFLGDW
jgi:hypothetical protein